MPTNFTLVKRGYNPIEVDNYIRTLEQQLNEYREKTTAINNAIINAQIAADNIIKEAHIKTDKILSGAEKDARILKQKTLSQLINIKKNVIGQKKLVESFQDEYTKLIKKYLSPVEENEVNPMISKLNEIENLIDELSKPQDDNISASKSSDKLKNNNYNDDKLNNKSNAAVTNPYAKVSDVSVTNPYAKVSEASVTNPYAKVSDVSITNPYAKINTKGKEDNIKNVKADSPFKKESNSNNMEKPKIINPFEKPYNSPFSNLEDSDDTLNSYPSKPGIYKASDLYDENSSKSDDEIFSASLSREEMEELMPPHN